MPVIFILALAIFAASRFGKTALTEKAYILLSDQQKGHLFSLTVQSRQIFRLILSTMFAVFLIALFCLQNYFLQIMAIFFIVTFTISSISTIYYYTIYSKEKLPPKFLETLRLSILVDNLGIILFMILFGYEMYPMLIKPI